MVNIVIMIGRLVADPELKYTSAGTAVTTFRLAVDRPKMKDKEQETDFINVVTWRHTAEFVANYLSKGRLAHIQGRMQNRSWVDKEGNKRWATEVIAQEVKPLDRPKQQSEGAESGAPGPNFDDEYDPVGGSEY
jgi:single-strand DNA-binding protein